MRNDAPGSQPQVIIHSVSQLLSMLDYRAMSKDHRSNSHLAIQDLSRNLKIILAQPASQPTAKSSGITANNSALQTYAAGTPSLTHITALYPVLMQVSSGDEVVGLIVWLTLLAATHIQRPEDARTFASILCNEHSRVFWRVLGNGNGSVHGAVFLLFEWICRAGASCSLFLASFGELGHPSFLKAVKNRKALEHSSAIHAALRVSASERVEPRGTQVTNDDDHHTLLSKVHTVREALMTLQITLFYTCTIEERLSLCKSPLVIHGILLTLYTHKPVFVSAFMRSLHLQIVDCDFKMMAASLFKGSNLFGASGAGAGGESVISFLPKMHGCGHEDSMKIASEYIRLWCTRPGKCLSYTNTATHTNFTVLKNRIISEVAMSLDYAPPRTTEERLPKTASPPPPSQLDLLVEVCAVNADVCWWWLGKHAGILAHALATTSREDGDGDGDDSLKVLYLLAVVKRLIALLPNSTLDSSDKAPSAAGGGELEGIVPSGFNRTLLSKLVLLDHPVLLVYGVRVVEAVIVGRLLPQNLTGNKANLKAAPSMAPKILPAPQTIQNVLIKLVRAVNARTEALDKSIFAIAPLVAIFDAYLEMGLSSGCGSGFIGFGDVCVEGEGGEEAVSGDEMVAKVFAEYQRGLCRVISHFQPHPFLGNPKDSATLASILAISPRHPRQDEEQDDTKARDHVKRLLAVWIQPLLKVSHSSKSTNGSCLDWPQMIIDAGLVSEAIEGCRRVWSEPLIFEGKDKADEANEEYSCVPLVQLLPSLLSLLKSGESGSDAGGSGGAGVHESVCEKYVRKSAGEEIDDPLTPNANEHKVATENGEVPASIHSDGRDDTAKDKASADDINFTSLKALWTHVATLSHKQSFKQIAYPKLFNSTGHQNVLDKHTAAIDAEYKTFENIGQLVDCLLVDYDPVVWLRLFARVLEEEKAEKPESSRWLDLSMCIQKGIVQLAMIALSAPHPSTNDTHRIIKHLSHFCLHSFQQILPASNIRERHQVHLVLSSLQNTILPPSLAAPAPFTLHLHANAIAIMQKPSHPLFRAINELLLEQPSLGRWCWQRMFMDANADWAACTDFILNCALDSLQSQHTKDGVNKGQFIGEEALIAQSGLPPFILNDLRTLCLCAQVSSTCSTLTCIPDRTLEKAQCIINIITNA